MVENPSSHCLVEIVAASALVLATSMCRADSVDDYVLMEMENQRLPGVALAVIRNGEAVKVQAYGVANIESGVAVTKDTVFALASVSKQILATAVMLLVDRGKLDLDDDIGPFLPDAPESWRHITVRQLLSHTAGLARMPPDFDWGIRQTNEEYVKSAYDVPLLSEPGEKWSYSNFGYFILAEVIASATGQPLPQFVAEQVFKPLGMTASRTLDYTDIVPNRAAGYIFRDGRQSNTPPLYSHNPGGAFMSTISDMVKWEAALSEMALISPESQDLMWTPVTLADGTSTGYGYG